MESVTCGWLSVVAVVRRLYLAFGGSTAWGPLTIAWLLIREGREA